MRCSSRISFTSRRKLSVSIKVSDSLISNRSFSSNAKSCMFSISLNSGAFAVNSATMSFNFVSASTRFAFSTCAAFSCSRNNSYALMSVNPSLVNFCSTADFDSPLNISSSVNFHAFVFLYSATSFFNCFSLSKHASKFISNCSIFFCDTAFSLIRAFDASSPASIVSFRIFSSF